MSDYTLTTDDVREIFYDAPGMQKAEYAGKFDSWLQRVKREAYSEGYEQGRDDALEDTYWQA